MIATCLIWESNPETVFAVVCAAKVVMAKHSQRVVVAPIILVGGRRRAAISCDEKK